MKIFKEKSLAFFPRMVTFSYEATGSSPQANYGL